MSRATPATRQLDQARVSYRLHTYDYDPKAQNIGAHAALSLGIDPVRMFKTLMTRVDGRPVCAIAPSDGDISLKRLAQAAHGKGAVMMDAAEAERLTGYKVGGISPFGQRKASPAFIAIEALGLETLFVNGGQRGLQVELAPRDLVAVLAATLAPLR
ncbi:MAG TPA: Cys-tRNA(Pro) deacylase [Phenylobacterium sp.]|nr:Cys-tRNA(Pro) deacylase [Phenylobacterium sp.]